MTRWVWNASGGSCFRFGPFLWGKSPDLAILAFFFISLFFLLHDIPCFFGAFSLLFQGFKELAERKSLLFFVGSSLCCQKSKDWRVSLYFGALRVKGAVPVMVLP